MHISESPAPSHIPVESVHSIRNRFMLGDVDSVCFSVARGKSFISQYYVQEVGAEELQNIIIELFEKELLNFPEM
jgi:hypothetical protein